MNQITGRIEMIGETKNVGKSKEFLKREIVIDTEDEGAKYPNPVILEAVQDKCALLDGLQKGQTVTISFFVNGRYWKNPKTNEGRFFNSLRVSKIEAGEGGGDTFAEAEGQEQPQSVSDVGDDEPPF